MASSEAAAEQQQMLKTQQLENKYKTMVRKNTTLDQMQTQLQRNEAHQAVSGGKFNSPSFFAVQADATQEGAEALRNADTAEALNDYSLKMQERSAQTQANYRKAGVITHTVGGVLGAYTGYENNEALRQRG